MTRTKKIVVYAMFAFLLSAMFPPWLYTNYQTGTRDWSGSRSEKNAGYHFLLIPPEPESNSQSRGIRMDGGRLVLEWLCIITASGLAWFGSSWLPRRNISESTAQSSPILSRKPWLTMKEGIFLFVPAVAFATFVSVSVIQRDKKDGHEIVKPELKGYTILEPELKGYKILEPEKPQSAKAPTFQPGKTPKWEETTAWTPPEVLQEGNTNGFATNARSRKPIPKPPDGFIINQSDYDSRPDAKP